MDFIKKLWTQTGQHLGELTRSQRIAIALCAVIVGGALIMLVHWSATRSYVPLPLAELSAEELADVESALVSMGVDYKVKANRVLVPPQRRTWVLGRLMESEAVAGKLSIDFARLIEADSPWLSENEKAWRRTVALSGELSKTISSMSGIQSARVFIDNTMRRGFAGRSVAPSAVVAVVPAGNFQIDKKRVHMLASLVSGAVAGLDITKVRVVDESAGRSYTAADPADAVAADLLEVRRSEERYYESKIYERLSYIPGVLASVFAEQETSLTQTQQTRLDKPVVSKSSTETTSESRGPLAAEPTPGTSRRKPPGRRRIGRTNGKRNYRRRVPGRARAGDHHPTEYARGGHPPDRLGRRAAKLAGHDLHGTQAGGRTPGRRSAAGL